jgi:hypothetical protein
LRDEVAGGSWQPGRSHKGGKKSFCCVTTRRRKLWLFHGLGRGLGPLTARLLGLGVPGFGLGSLAMFGLPLGRLPLADLAETFRVLAVALVPAPRLILAAAPFAQASSPAQSAPSGRAVRLSLSVEGAHGRFDLPREKLGENVSPFSSGVFRNANKTVPRQCKACEANKTKKKTDFEARLGRRHADRGLTP